MKTSPFRNITIVGVGLIGGSLGLAIKRHFPGTLVKGVDKPGVLRRALRRKAIDEGTTRLPQAARSADLIILAVPIKAILRSFPIIAGSCGKQTLVTDVGSVKGPVVRAAKRWFPGGNFIGGHPMAGVELSGVEAAHPLLFENAVYVLTPGRKTPRRFVVRLSSFLGRLGARTLLMDPATHDQVASAVSHVPQLIAVALMNLAGSRHRHYLRLAAGGFRDLTRIASSRFDLWSEILPMNRLEVARSLDLFIDELEGYRRALKSGGAGLKKSFSNARKLRNSIPRDMKGFIHRLAEIQVFVNDRPGMLAKLASSLARARINIKDIELMKVKEGRGGTFRLAFDSHDLATKARTILGRNGFEVEE